MFEMMKNIEKGFNFKKIKGEYQPKMIFSCKDKGRYKIMYLH